MKMAATNWIRLTSYYRDDSAFLRGWSSSVRAQRFEPSPFGYLLDYPIGCTGAFAGIL